MLIKYQFDDVEILRFARGCFSWKQKEKQKPRRVMYFGIKFAFFKIVCYNN